MLNAVENKLCICQKKMGRPMIPRETGAVKRDSALSVVKRNIANLNVNVRPKFKG